MSIYFTHNNGARPFMVQIDDNGIKIYQVKEELVNRKKTRKNKKKDKDKVNTELILVKNGSSSIYTFPSAYESKAIYTINTENINKIYIGTNSGSTIYGKADDNEILPHNEYKGNSILVELKNDVYVYIGHAIKLFKTYAKIVRYVSRVGNSDIVYPYAIDKTNNYYLPIADGIVFNYQLFEEPYEYYYPALTIIVNNEKDKTIIKNFNKIAKFYIGNTKKRLNYPYELDENKKIYISKIDNAGKIENKQEVSHEYIKEVIYNYGKHVGIGEMHIIKNIAANI